MSDKLGSKEGVLLIRSFRATITTTNILFVLLTEGEAPSTVGQTGERTGKELKLEQ